VQDSKIQSQQQNYEQVEAGPQPDSIHIYTWLSPVKVAKECRITPGSAAGKNNLGEAEVFASPTAADC
jgi:hypothetical protein